MLARLRSRFSRVSPKAVTEWNQKRIGAVSLLIVAAIVGGALALTSNVFASTYPLNARFVNAVGLNPGAVVYMAGVQVGKVADVKVAGDHVVAQLSINDGVQIPADSTADISVETLLGVIGVNIEPGGNWARLLRGGSTITNTAVPYEFFEIRNIAGSQLSGTNAAALAQVVSDLSKATSGDKTQIQELVRGLAQLTGTVDAHRVEAGQLIDAARTLSAVLASKDAQLTTVVNDLDLVVQGLADRSSQLGTLITATEQTAQQTSSLIGRNQPRLQEMLTALHQALQVIGAHQLDIARSVAFAASAIKGFSSIGQSGNSMPPWTNVYTNIVGSAAGYGVLGNCGALDQALDVALGPDPKPCSQRTGPIPNVPVPNSGPPTASVSALFSPLATFPITPSTAGAKS